MESLVQFLTQLHTGIQEIQALVEWVLHVHNQLCDIVKFLQLQGASIQQMWAEWQ